MPRSLSGPRQDGLVALAVLTLAVAAVVLLGQTLAAGDDMLLLQLEGRGAGPAGNFVAGSLVGLVLAGIGIAAAVRVSGKDGSWPGALLVVGTALAALAGALLAMVAAQGSVGMSVADAVAVRGATAPGQWVTGVTALVLAGAAVPCVVVGARRWRRTG
ncbi:hypothetical protein [Cellulomonas aerilata]|uniref:Uncharacterized protein n=1 Tax=Cellulomonas aerilata TaxID=515326 RepID=A0A512D8A1_9CELL|nr:hypothetical protein [Cellulomonas aerilata]GEO32615.1 hypothetical protein CAE01nite_03400 [Cellulomonas aerilata]